MEKDEEVEVPNSATSGSKEGFNLLGSPTFEMLETGRLKCVETGHELPPSSAESYALSKHCRLGLIDSAISNKKPPLNMFQVDSQSRSKLICKLTGITINKSEEHIWKHISGKRFLKQLEEKEAEKNREKNGIRKPDENKEKKKKKEKEKGKKKEKKKKDEEKEDEVLLDVRDPAESNEDCSEETDFWIPPVGERWDHDDGGERWDSGSESDDAGEEAIAGAKEVCKEAEELSKQTKRISLAVGPSSFASRKKKRKTNAS